MTCPLCQSPEPFEHFSDGSRLCLNPTCGIAFWMSDDGEFVMWAETSKSHPVVPSNAVIVNRARLVVAKRG